MGKQFPALEKKHIKFIQAQKLFFVGTAAQDGRVNVSPKGMDSFRVLDANTVAWLNLTGSGNETSAHVQQLPRMTLMMCSFEGAPVILRMYGTATVRHQGDRDWDRHIELFPQLPGSRQVFVLKIDLVQTSCGYGVPLFDYVGDRDGLNKWAEKKGDRGIQKYWTKNNQVSLDGQPTEILERSGIEERPSKLPFF
ncbi:MAG: pyridoxamine 5'-phosphate oxidase family protein [Cyanophyceae cyanobacterium]